MGDIHVGVTLPQIKRTWDEAKVAAQTFEELGFDSVWVCDHLYGVPTAATPILEAWSELTAVAAITERVELGSLVTPPLFRTPALFAKQIATIDNIANGRVIVGLGAGWYQDEFEGYDRPFPSLKERMDALEETCELLPRLWSEPSVTYEGTWARAHETVCEPKPPRKPPILIGGSGEKRLMGIAARHADIWNNLQVTEGELGPKVEALHRRCADVGRDPAEITVSQQTIVVLGESEDDARDNLGKAVKVYGGHLGAGIEAHGIWGDPDGVIRRMQGHIDKGCTMFVIEFFGRDTKIPAKLFAEEVLPAFQ